MLRLDSEQEAGVSMGPKALTSRRCLKHTTQHVLGESARPEEPRSCRLTAFYRLTTRVQVLPEKVM